MWNFLVKCREVITQYLTWKVYKGEKELFWMDSWNGYPPLNNNKDIQNAKLILIATRGPKIKNYLDFTSVKENIVKWRDFSNLQFPFIRKNLLQKILEHLIFSSNRLDK